MYNLKHLYKKNIYSFIFLITVLATHFCYASPHYLSLNDSIPLLVLDSQSKTVDLSEILEISTENTPSLDSVLNSHQFQSLKAFNESFTTLHYYWFRVKIINTSDNMGDSYYLSLKKIESLEGYDHFNIYEIHKGQISFHKTGRLVNLQDRYDSAFKSLLPITLNKNDTTIIYFNLFQEYKPIVPVKPLIIIQSILKNKLYDLGNRLTIFNFLIAGCIFLFVFIIIINLLRNVK